MSNIRDELDYRKQLKATLILSMRDINVKNGINIDVDDLHEIGDLMVTTILKLFHSIDKNHKRDSNDILIQTLQLYDDLFSFININIEQEFTKYIGGSNEVLN